MTRALERTPSVRLRLLHWLLAPLLVVAAGGALLEYAIASGLLQYEYDDALRNLALAVTAHVQSDASGSLHMQLSSDAAALMRLNGVDRRYYLVIGSDGQYIDGDLQLSLTSSSRDSDLVFRDATRRGDRVRLVIHRASIAGRDVIVAATEPTRARDAASRHLLLAAIGGNGAQFALTLIVVWIGVRKGLSPLLRLRDAVAANPSLELPQFVEESAPDETRPLIRALNQAIERVREATAARQQFVADAAHQLRNPLAAAQAGLRALAVEVCDTPQQRRVQDLLTDSRRLARTTHQLLAMAQTDATAPLPSEFTSVDLRQLVIANAEHAFDRARKADIDLGIEADDARVNGIVWLLNEALANLIDNAITYAQRGGRVTIRCGLRLAQVFLEVEDDGPGIPPDERDRVRDRFYRGRGAAADGTGLGLAIVEQVARVHSAEFSISTGAGERGTRCRMDFPPRRTSTPGNPLQ